MSNLPPLPNSGNLPFRQNVFRYVCKRCGYANASDLFRAIDAAQPRGKIKERALQYIWNDEDRHTIRASTARALGEFLGIDPRDLLRLLGDERADADVMASLSEQLPPPEMPPSPEATPQDLPPQSLTDEVPLTGSDHDDPFASPDQTEPAGSSTPADQPTKEPPPPYWMDLLQSEDSRLPFIDPGEIDEAPNAYLKQVQGLFDQGLTDSAVRGLQAFFGSKRARDGEMPEDAVAYARLIQAWIYTEWGLLAPARNSLAVANYFTQYVRGPFRNALFASAYLSVGVLDHILKNKTQSIKSIQRATDMYLTDVESLPDIAFLKHIADGRFARAMCQDEDLFYDGIGLQGKVLDEADRKKQGQVTPRLNIASAWLHNALNNPRSVPIGKKGALGLAESILSEVPWVEPPDTKPYANYLQLFLWTQFFVVQGAVGDARVCFQKAWDCATGGPIAQLHHVTELLEFASEHPECIPLPVQDRIDRHASTCLKCGKTKLANRVQCVAQTTRKELASSRNTPFDLEGLLPPDPDLAPDPEPDPAPEPKLDTDTDNLDEE